MPHARARVCVRVCVCVCVWQVQKANYIAAVDNYYFMIIQVCMDYYIHNYCKGKTLCNLYQIHCHMCVCVCVPFF